MEEIDDCNLFQQCQPNLFDDEDFISHDIASVLHQEENLQQQQQPLSSESYSSYNLERPNKKLKTKNTLQDLSPVSSPSSTTSQIMSFEKSKSFSSINEVVMFQTQKGSLQKNNFVETMNSQGQGTKRSMANNQEHIIAERKRREKLSQSLIALAALIPGLKKVLLLSMSLSFINS